MVKSFLAWLKERSSPLLIEEIILTENGASGRLLREGKSYDGRFKEGIRVDNATYGAGQRHAHIFGRKGAELGVVNLDGTGSHGSKMRLHPKDAAALRNLGFTVHPEGVVEWTKVSNSAVFLIED